MGWFGKPTPTAAVLSIDVPVTFNVPPKTQWAFTPELQSRSIEGGMAGAILTGTGIGESITLHHSGEGQVFSIQPMDDYAAGLEFDFPDFEGDFFSLAIALPDEGITTLGPQDLLRLSLHTATNAPFDAYARLNLCHGPNTEKITRMVRIGEGNSFVEFDIFYTEFESGRATSVWIDLIINDPRGKCVSLDEVVVLRRARASL